jgi:enterochelin esterase family protein
MPLHKLLLRAQREGTPLVDGSQVTFVWHGKTAPQLIGDFNGWGYVSPPVTMQQAGRGVWAYTVTIDPRAYMEYVYMSDYAKAERVYDPLNPRKINNGFDKFNHYFDMPACQHTTLVRPRPGIAHGTVTKHTLTHDYLLADGKRDVWLYQPPTPVPTPLIVVFDGSDYLRRQHITVIVDNLIAQGRIRPLSLALVGNGKRARFVEYAPSEATLGWILDDVLTLAQQHLKLIDIEKQPGAYGVLGSSMGGLMALYAGLRAPHVFGNILSQSGAFRIEVLKQPPLIDQLVAQYTGTPLNVWMDCGIYEWLIAANRAMSPLLKAKGHRVTYREYAGGHNVISWRNELPHGLETLFPLE